MGALPHPKPWSIEQYWNFSPDQQKAARSAIWRIAAVAGLSDRSCNIALTLVRTNGDIAATARMRRISPAAVRVHARLWRNIGFHLTRKKPNQERLRRELGLYAFGRAVQKLQLARLSVAVYDRFGQRLKIRDAHQIEQTIFAKAFSYVTTHELARPLTVAQCAYLYRFASGLRATNAETLFCFLYSRIYPRLQKIRYFGPAYCESIIRNHWLNPREKSFRGLLPLSFARPAMLPAPPEHRPPTLCALLKQFQQALWNDFRARPPN